MEHPVKYPRQRSSRHLPCSSCQHFELSEHYFWCEHQQPSFPQRCCSFLSEERENFPISKFKTILGELTNAFV